LIDSGPPTLSTLQAFDANANGRIDQVVATFSENLAAYAAGTTPWTLSNVPSNGHLASVAVSGAAATLTLTEGTGSATTALGNFKVALAANAAGIRDAAGNTASFAAQAPADKAAPARTSMDMRDNDSDGRIDRVVVTFSESLSTPYSAGNTPWTLAGVPSGGSLGSVSVSGSTATLTVTEGSGAQDTAVGSLTVALAASTTGIRDAAGNQSAFVATAPADAAKPLAVAVAAADGGGTASRMQTGDTLSLTYSEAIDPASILTGWSGTGTSVTLRVDNGSSLSGDDSVIIRSGSSTLDLGSVNLNRYDYVSGGDVDFTGSTMVRNGATITITLGTPDQPSRIVTAGGAENMTWSPSTGAADPAGNAALGTAVTETGTSDRDF
jgi:acid phosphatase family membrane protein YuiD